MENNQYLQETLKYINMHNVDYKVQPWYKKHIEDHPFTNNPHLSQFIYQPYDEKGKIPTLRLIESKKYEDLKTKKIFNIDKPRPKKEAKTIDYIGTFIFDTHDRVNFPQKCYREDGMGIPNKLKTKLHPPQEQDYDIDTDEEKYDRDIKKCEAELKFGIIEELKDCKQIHMDDNRTLTEIMAWQKALGLPLDLSIRYETVPDYPD